MSKIVGKSLPRRTSTRAWMLDGNEQPQPQSVNRSYINISLFDNILVEERWNKTIPNIIDNMKEFALMIIKYIFCCKIIFSHRTLNFSLLSQ